MNNGIDTFEAYRIQNMSKEQFLTNYSLFEELLEQEEFIPGVDFDYSIEEKDDSLIIDIEIYEIAMGKPKFDKLQALAKELFDIVIKEQ